MASWKWIGILGVFLWANGANAFSLGDHRKVTQALLQEVKLCAPEIFKAFPQGTENLIVSSVLREDLNLARKWSFYSHYYNPFKKLKMRRADSSVSIAMAQKSLYPNLSSDHIHKNLVLFGRILHHLQDAAVPSHVVPVEHGFEDGFEKFAVDLNPSQDCGWVNEVPKESPLEMLRATAITTYDRLEESVSYTRSGYSEQANWFRLFWSVDVGPGFGRYGAFGNHFGVTRFKLGGDEIQVDQVIFQRFKEAQFQLAVSVSRSAFLWFYQFTHPKQL